MAVLDDLSGFEFEDLMEDVFRNLGYENVRQADRTADEGRDVLMEEVVDGTDLREIADDIGLDLYNGRIEILCDEMLRPYDPAASVHAPVEEAFRDVQNIDVADLPDPHVRVRFRPVVTITADTNAVFETSVGVTYNKTCEPNQSDISVQSIDAVYLPEVRQTTELQDYSYPYEYYAAGPSRVTIEDGIHRCVHCETAGTGATYTYCANCGSISCGTHTKTERLEGEPVCTGCAVTERFALKTKYFYDEGNIETFREEYEQMPVHEKALENKLLVGGALVTTLLLLVGLLVVLGGI